MSRSQGRLAHAPCVPHMPLSGRDALLLWIGGRTIQDFCCSVPPDSCSVELDYDPRRQRLHCSIRVVRFRLPSGRTFAMRGHITLLVLRSLHTPPPPNLVHRTERMARRLLAMTHVRTAGDPTPLYDNDGDPHWLLLHIHLESQLHQQIYGP